MSTVRATQSQSIKFQNPLEVSEEHLDLLAILARLFVSTRLGNVARHVPCRFMDAASDFPSRCVRTTARLHWAGRTIGLARSIDDGVSLRDMVTRVPECTPLAAQRMALRAAVFVGLFVPSKVATG